MVTLRLVENPPADPIAAFTAYVKGPFVGAVGRAFNMPTPRVGVVSVLPDDSMPSGEDAFFTTVTVQDDTLIGALLPPGSMMTAINVSHHTALMVGAFLEGKSPLIPDAPRQEFMTEVKRNLMMLAHESVHAFKARSREQIRAHDQELTSTPGMRAMMEGLTQVATEVRFDQIVAALGADQIDERLADAPSGHEYFYVGLTDATRALVTAVSERSGVNERELTREVVRRDCGRAAVDYLVETFLGGPGASDPALVTVATDRLLKRSATMDAAIDATLAAVDGGPASNLPITRARSIGVAGAAEEVAALDALRAMSTGTILPSVAHEGLG